MDKGVSMLVGHIGVQRCRVADWSRRWVWSPEGKDLRSHSCECGSGHERWCQGSTSGTS